MSYLQGAMLKRLAEQTQSVVLTTNQVTIKLLQYFVNIRIGKCHDVAPYGTAGHGERKQ